ncbi:hypothetical protein TrST_g2078 [Triparma strigata]|uniref:Uncharacterized protein n=1 Tax=Triparma strigata TaxID=1606541 RepID=A0A9W7A8E1_9STRA|nr:hypothetical protein TrST_g2078 [Triparma strigata]
MSSDSQQPHSNGSNGVDNAVEDAVEGLGLHQLDRQMNWKAKYDELKTKSVAFAKQTSQTIQTLQTSLSNEQATNTSIKEKTKKFVLEQKTIREGLESQIATLQAEASKVASAPPPAPPPTAVAAETEELTKLKSELTSITDSMVTSKLAAAEEVASLKQKLSDVSSKSEAATITLRTKDSEIKRLNETIATLKSEAAATLKSLEEKTNTMKLKELNYAQALKSVEEYKEKSSSLESSLSASSSITSELQKKLQTLLEDKGEQESSLKLAYANASSSNVSLNKRVKELEALTSKVSENDALKKENERLKEKEKELEKIKDEKEKGRREIIKVKKEREEREDRVNDLLSHASTVERRLGEVTAAKEGVEKELREVRTKAKMVVDRLTKEVGGLRSEKEGVERKLEEVKGYVQGRDEDKTVLEGLRGRVSKAEVAVADLTAENEGLKNQFKANNDELSVHKAKRLNAKSEVQKVVKQLTKIKKEHEEVVEYLDYTVVGRLDTVGKEVEGLVRGFSFCVEMLCKEKGVKATSSSRVGVQGAGVELTGLGGEAGGGGVVAKLEERMRRVEGGVRFLEGERGRLEEVVEGGGGGCFDSIMKVFGGGVTNLGQVVKEVGSKDSGYGRVGGGMIDGEDNDEESEEGVFT